MLCFPELQHRQVSYKSDISIYQRTLTFFNKDVFTKLLSSVILKFEICCAGVFPWYIYIIAYILGTCKYLKCFSFLAFVFHENYLFTIFQLSIILQHFVEYSPFKSLVFITGIIRISEEHIIISTVI